MIDRALVAELGASIAERHEALSARLDDAGATDVELVPVSKGQSVESVVAAVELGLGHCGENYAQELEAKALAIDEAGLAGPAWHFVGRLQKNKVRVVADRVTLWQSVDRFKIGREIAKRAPGAKILVQVNLSDDPDKGGCAKHKLGRLVDELGVVDVEVEGLMGVGSQGDELATAESFRWLRSEVDRLGLAQCSMGMSDDLEIAVGEGSTMIRVGSALFGSRPTPGETAEDPRDSAP